MKAINDAHELEYGIKPEVIAKAPGRFHLIGDHSWFFKDKTLSMAVNLTIYIAISKRSDNNLKFYFIQPNERKKATVSSLKYKKEDKWANSLKAVLYGFLSCGYEFSGMDITIYSQIPPAAGFGITSAMKAALVIAIKKLFSFKCSDVQLLQVLENGNRNFLHVQNYLANHYSALFSKKSNLLITDYSKSTWDYIPFDFEDKKVLLVDTKVPRFSVWNEESICEPQYALLLGDLRERKANVYGGWQYISDKTEINEVLSVVSEEVQRKLKSVMREHGDLLEAREGILNKDFFKLARAINNSHETMRDMYNISCPEIDWLLKRVSELEPNLENTRNPVTCGRITGHGFGRCLYAIIRNCDYEKFLAKLSEFEKIFGFKPECYEVLPEDGASLVID